MFHAVFEVRNEHSIEKNAEIRAADDHFEERLIRVTMIKRVAVCLLLPELFQALPRMCNHTTPGVLHRSTEYVMETFSRASARLMLDRTDSSPREERTPGTAQNRAHGGRYSHTPRQYI